MVGLLVVGALHLGTPAVVGVAMRMKPMMSV
jgi:hypothetical protein